MSLTTVQVLPSSVQGLRRTLARDADGTLVEVIEGAGARAANLPHGGLFPRVRAEEGDRVILGPPLARSLAALHPPPLAALAFVERLLQDLETLRAGGGAHGALHPDGWGADAGGVLRARAILHFPAPTGQPWTADLAAVGSGLRGLVDLAQAEAAGVTHMRVWARAMGTAGERVSFPDARAARQALAAALARVDAQGALADWMKQVGVRLPEAPRAFATTPVARAPLNPDPERSARAWVEREIARTRAERYLELRKDVERQLVADRMEAERSTREGESRRTSAAEARERAHAALLEERRVRDTRAREETLARLDEAASHVARPAPQPTPPTDSDTSPHTTESPAARVRIGGGSNDLRIRALPSLASTVPERAGTLEGSGPDPRAGTALPAPALTGVASEAGGLTQRHRDTEAGKEEEKPAFTPAPTITLPHAPVPDVAAPAAPPTFTLPPPPVPELPAPAAAPTITLPAAPVAPATAATTITLPPAPVPQVESPTPAAPTITLPPAPVTQVESPTPAAPAIALPPAPVTQVETPALATPALTIPLAPVTSAPPPTSVLPLPTPERDTTVTLRVPAPSAAAPPKPPPVTTAPPHASPGEALRRGPPPPQKMDVHPDEDRPTWAGAAPVRGDSSRQDERGAGKWADAPPARPRAPLDLDAVPPETDGPAWTGLRGVTGSSDRMYEKGAGKWGDAQARPELRDMMRDMDREERADLDLGSAPASPGLPVAAWIGLAIATIAAFAWWMA